MSLYNVTFTAAKPSNDGTNVPPTTILQLLILLCIIIGNNLCACKGAPYHRVIYLKIRLEYQFSYLRLIFHIRCNISTKRKIIFQYSVLVIYRMYIFLLKFLFLMLNCFHISC